MPIKPSDMPILKLSPYFKAFSRLPKTDQETISLLADRLQGSMKSLRPDTQQFGPLSAYELLAKLGIFLNKRANHDQAS